ncbi:MAG: cytochrome c biogenesis CcdA family protein [Candidatus Dormibacteria bacterium]
MVALLSPSYPLALLAGLVSFLSPCVFPLVPAYAAYLGGRAGQGGAEAAALVPSGPGAATLAVRQASPRVPVIANGVAFVLGFMAVFIALFYVLSALEVNFLLQHRLAVNRVAGTIVILLALQTMGVIRIPLLMREVRFHHVPIGGGGLGAFLLGVTFAAGWSPCIGPQLGAILQVAVSGNFAGLPFMLVYCLGLAIPFLLVAALADRLQDPIRAINRHLGVINKVAGLLLLGFGLLLVSDAITVLNTYSFAAPFNL